MCEGSKRRREARPLFFIIYNDCMIYARGIGGFKADLRSIWIVFFLIQMASFDIPCVCLVYISAYQAQGGVVGSFNLTRAFELSVADHQPPTQ